MSHVFLNHAMTFDYDKIPEIYRQLIVLIFKQNTAIVVHNQFQTAILFINKMLKSFRN